VAPLSEAKATVKIMKTNTSLKFYSMASLLLLAGALTLKAATDTWTGATSFNWADANWTGGNTTPVAGDTLAFGPTVGGFGATLTDNLGAAFGLAGLTFNPGASAFTLNTSGGGDTIAASGGFIDNAANTETINIPVVWAAANSMYVIGGGTLVQDGAISGGGGNYALTKTGFGTLTLGGQNSLGTGSTTINAGTLTLDFTQSGAPSANIVSATSPLSMKGGNLTVNSAVSSGSATIQTFASTAVAGGANVLTIADSAGGTPTVALGAITPTTGATVEFVGPPTIGAGNAAVAATGIFTTTSAGVGGASTPFGLISQPITSGVGINYATVGLYDWATTDPAGAPSAGASPYKIIGGSQVTGFYTNLASGNLSEGVNVNLDITGTSGVAASGSRETYGSFRFNSATANITFTINVGKTGGGNPQSVGGILMTPNFGAHNVTFTDPCTGNLNGNNNGTPSLVVFQNNTLGELIFGLNTSATPADGLIGNASGYIQSGLGTVSFAGPNSYTGSTWLNGGVLQIAGDSGLGAINTTVNLNGGTLLGNYIGYLDNGTHNTTADEHPIALGNNGGGLAATAGNTLTIDGVVSGSGPLTIGLPTAGGLVPGTGAGTAFTTATNATGTVQLEPSPSPNTATGGTVLDTGILNVSSTGLPTGGLTFNGGTFQWIASTPDISAQTVTINPASGNLAGGATLDLNQNVVTLANAIGNGGSGSLAVNSTGGAGTLNLTGGITSTGGTTVGINATLNVNGTAAGNVTVGSSSGTFGGSGTVSGNVNVSSGTFGTTTGYLTSVGGTLTLGNTASANLSVSPSKAGGSAILTVSGTATFSSGTPNSINIYVPGGTGLGVGTYTLLTAGSIGGSVASIPTYTGAGLAVGTVGQITQSGGNSLILTVSLSGTTATWTDGNSDGTWLATDGGDWTGGTAPQSAGDTAIFGTGASPVSLTGPVAVGTITFNNPSSYTISGSQILTLDNKGNGALIDASTTAGNNNIISTPISLADSDNLTINVGSTFSMAINGAITATGSQPVNIPGAGTTILGSANSYTGNTTLSGGGTLQVNNSGALGSGALSATASTVQLGSGVNGQTLANNITLGTGTTTVDNNGGNSATLSGVISGGGNLSAVNSGSGAGVVVLGSANTYAGKTTVGTGAAVNISADTSLGTTPGSVTLNDIVINGGDLQGSGSVSANRGIGIGASGAYVDAATSGTLTLSGIIAADGGNNLTVNSIVGTPGTVILAGANTFSGTTSFGSGTLQLNNSLALQNSTLNITGGTLNFDSLPATITGLTGTGNINLPVALTIGSSATPAAYSGTLSGVGSVTKTGSGGITIGSGASGGATYSGATTVNQGTLTFGGVGSMNAGANVILVAGTLGTATLNVVDTASVVTTGNTAVGQFSANTTSLVLGGGTGGGSLSAGTLTFGTVNNGPGTASVTIQNSGSLTLSGHIDMDDGHSGSQAGTTTVNLNGGTFTVGSIMNTFNTASVPETIHLNGGVLKANANDTSGTVFFLPALANFTADVDSGGAIVNPNGHTITIAQPLVHGTGTPDGGLTVNGNGTLTLSGADTYTGGTIDSNSTLLVNGSIGSGAVTVTNATLGGSGTIGGATTLQPYSILSAGTNGIGTLNFSSSLALDPASTNSFVVTTAGGASNKVAVVGALTANNSVIKITSGTPLHGGTNTLFTYGTFSGPFNPAVVFDVAPVHSYAIVDDTLGHINLLVSNTPPVFGVASFTNYVTLNTASIIQVIGGKYGPTDADADTLIITGVTGNANGTVTFTATNITYTATNGTSDSFTVTVSDGNGGTASQTIYAVISAPTGQGPNLVNMSVVGATVFLNFAGIPNDKYALEGTPNLTPPITWTPIVTNTAASNGSLPFTDSTSSGYNFYRTRYVP